MIKRARKPFEAAFASLHDPVLIVDRGGKIREANAAAQRILDLGDRSHLGDVVSLEPAFALDGDTLLSLVRRNGAVVSHRLKDAEGNPADALVDVVDVDDQKIGRELRVVHIKNFTPINRYERWKDELISMVAHEIKNPLAAMKQSMHLLASEEPGPITEGQGRLLTTSIRSINRLARLIDGFLDVSRIGAGNFTLDQRWVSARQFVPDVIESFEALFNVNRQQLDYTISDEVRELYIDPAKVEQILINLLSNAVKYTPNGGDIHVDVSPASLEALDDDYRILPWADICPMRFVAISVRDTGIGMGGDTIAHLFTRYHGGNGNEAPEPRVPGSHLGLNISKTLTEVQNGALHVESEPGVGTEAVVYLPEDQQTSEALGRMRSFGRCFTASLSRRQDLNIYALRKYESARWSDIAERLEQNLIVNPSADAERNGSGFMWTLGPSVALILVPEGKTPPALAALVGYDESRYGVSGDGYTIGHSRAPGDDTRMTRLVNLAVKRMKQAPPVISKVHARI